MCASKMLRHVNLQHYSESIRNAIREVLAAGKVSNFKYCFVGYNKKICYNLPINFGLYIRVKIMFLRRIKIFKNNLHIIFYYFIF